MGIESVDRIERMTLADAPDVFEVMASCGEVWIIQKHFATIYESEDGIIPSFACKVTSPWDVIPSIIIPADKEFNVLVPDTLNDPVTQAEIVIALHNKGIDF